MRRSPPTLSSLNYPLFFRMTSSQSPQNNIKFLIPSLSSPLQAVSSPAPSIPSLEPNEILIRVRSIAVNPADVKMIDSGHRISSWPLVAGLDGSGVVEGLGSGVTRNFSLGDEVLATFSVGDREGGSFQRYAVVQERCVARKPADWGFDEASSLSVCFSTAVVGLGLGLRIPLPFLLRQNDDNNHKNNTDKPPPSSSSSSEYKPSSVLILGGSSALGAATIQLLRLTNPQCLILATSSPSHHHHLTDYLGADVALDRNSDTLVEDVRKAMATTTTTGGEEIGVRGVGVDAIFDAVGAARFYNNIFEAMDPQGSKRYAQVWTGDDEIEVPPGIDSVMFRSRDLLNLEGGVNLMVALERLLAEGKYKIPVPVENVGLNGLEGLERALGLMRAGRVSGKKLVVSVD